MQRLFHVICTALLFFGPLGCGENYEPVESPTAPYQAESQPAVEPMQPDPAAPAETQPEPPAAEISPEVSPEPEPVPEPFIDPAPLQPETPSPPPAIAQPAVPISLDLGVALGQPGPEGTWMMFSVKYEFVAGGPDPKTQYVWVIERAKGDPARITVALQNNGELNTGITGWRPEHGPFHSHIEDPEGKRLSDSIDMR